MGLFKKNKKGKRKGKKTYVCGGCHKKFSAGQGGHNATSCGKTTQIPQTSTGPTPQTEQKTSTTTTDAVKTALDKMSPKQKNKKSEKNDAMVQYEQTRKQEKVATEGATVMNFVNKNFDTFTEQEMKNFFDKLPAPVVEWVAGNGYGKNYPEVIEILFNHPNPKVRVGIAKCEQIEPYTLLRLKHYDDSEIAMALVCNSNYPETARRSLIHQEWLQTDASKILKQYEKNPTPEMADSAELAKLFIYQTRIYHMIQNDMF